MGNPVDRNSPVNQSYSCQQFCLWICNLLSALANRIIDIACPCFRNRNERRQSEPNIPPIRATSIPAETSSSASERTRTASIGQDVLLPTQPVIMRDLALELIEEFNLAKIVEIDKFNKDGFEGVQARFITLCEERRADILLKLESIKKEMTTVEEFNAFCSICLEWNKILPSQCDPISDNPMDPWARIFHDVAKDCVKDVYLKNKNRNEIRFVHFMEYALRSCTFEDLRDHQISPINRNSEIRGEFCMIAPQEQLKCLQGYPGKNRADILLRLIEIAGWHEYSTRHDDDKCPAESRITINNLLSTGINALTVFNDIIDDHPEKDRLLDKLHKTYSAQIGRMTGQLRPNDPRRYFYEVSIKFVLVRNGKIANDNSAIVSSSQELVGKSIPMPPQPRDIALELVENFTLSKILEISKIKDWSGNDIGPSKYEKQFIILCEARKQEIILKLESIKKEMTTVEEFNAFCTVCVSIRHNGTVYTMIHAFNDAAKECAKRIYLTDPDRNKMRPDFRYPAVKSCTLEELKEHRLSPLDNTFSKYACMLLETEQQLKCFREWSKVNIHLLVEFIEYVDRSWYIEDGFSYNPDAVLSSAKNALTVLDEIIDQHPERDKILQEKLKPQLDKSKRIVLSTSRRLFCDNSLGPFLQKHRI